MEKRNFIHASSLGVQFDGKMLVFQNQEHFHRIIEELIWARQGRCCDDEQIFLDFERSLDGFRSLRRKIDLQSQMIQSEKGFLADLSNHPENKYVGVPELQILLNEDELVRMGKSIYKFGKKGAEMIEGVDKEAFNALQKQFMGKEQTQEKGNSCCFLTYNGEAIYPISSPARKMHGVFILYAVSYTSLGNTITYNIFTCKTKTFKQNANGNWVNSYPGTSEVEGNITATKVNCTDGPFFNVNVPYKSRNLVHEVANSVQRGGLHRVTTSNNHHTIFNGSPYFMINQFFNIC